MLEALKCGLFLVLFSAAAGKDLAAPPAPGPLQTHSSRLGMEASHDRWVHPDPGRDNAM